jgi:DNA-binding CsgD family transcriptional regulator
MGRMIGRDAEIAALQGWLADPWARLAIVEGEAGIGKTSVWRRACALAEERGHAVVACSPTAAERHLVFAGLTDLLGPLLPPAAGAMAPSRRRAIEAALLMGDGEAEAPDERAVAFAALDVLRLAGSDRPLVVAIDDAQWLDRSSMAVIAFAARRLVPADRVAVMAARRSGVEDDASRALVDAVDPELRTTVTIGPLSLGAVHRLYRERLGLSLSRPRIVQAHAACAGNPLFALEIGRALVNDPRPPDGRLPLPPSLAEALGARLRALSPSGRRVTVLAAAAAAPPAALPAAAGAERHAIAEATAAAILVAGDGDTLRFDHPLLASVAYESGSERERRAAHAVLATVVTAAEERARHLALAQAGPDAPAAAALDHAADVAEARGAQAAGGDLREWAAQMTPAADVDALTRRLVAAGHTMLLSGDAGRGRRLLERAAAAAGPGRYEALWVLGTFADELANGRAPREYWDEALATGDLALRVQVELSIALSALWIESIPAGLTHATRAVRAAESLGDSRLLAQALGISGAALVLGGDDRAAGVLARAVALQGEAEVAELPWSPRALTADTARHTLQLEVARDLYARLRDVAVARGDVRLEAWAACGAGEVAIDAGMWTLAPQRRETAEELGEQTGLMNLPALRLGARLDACRGEVERSRAQLDRCLAQTRAAGEPLHELYALTILGALELSLGDFAAASAALEPCRAIAVAHGLRATGPLRFAVDQVEALAGLGRLDEAADLLDWFAPPAGAEWARPLVDRCRGLIAAGAGDLEEGVRLLGASQLAGEVLPLPLERARTDLCLGRVLRRAKRRAQARAALDRATRAFDALGSPLWAAQARADGARIGGRSRAGGLTESEAQVARLVSEGRSNKDVATLLFVAPSTVEAHLTSVYGKLGVSSRNQLAGALADQSQGVSRVSAPRRRA